MLNFEPTVTVPSESCPGVEIVVRRLSRVERAKRDLTIAPHQLRLTILRKQSEVLLAPYKEALEKWGEEHPDLEPDFLPSEVVEKIYAIRMEQDNLGDVWVKPATIRAGLVELKGIQYGGKPATAELLIANGPDDLIDEVFVVIAQNMTLSAVQAKNSESPSDSNVVGTKGEASTTATTA